MDLPTSYMQLDGTLGAIFIGVLVSAILFGLTNLQTFVYFLNYRNDSWLGYKSSVVALWCLDALHLALIAHGLYFYLVTNYGESLALVRIVWSFKFQVVLEVVVVLAVETLYILHIWKVYMADLRLTSCSSRARFIPCIPSCFLIGTAAVGIVLCCETYQLETFDDIPRISWATFSALAVATVVDLSIASSLCFFLANRKPGIIKVDTTIELLMLYTIDTGFITSACSLLALATCIVWHSYFVFIGVEYVLTTLYVNSFLAMLNARHTVPSQLQDGTPRPNSESSETATPDSQCSIPRLSWHDSEKQETSSTCKALPRTELHSYDLERNTVESCVLASLQSELECWSTPRRTQLLDDDVSRASSEILQFQG
ncbi:hypothetical protein BDZ89DRAFT_347249 [Hymenopellis radicata]|nr:hypothetical protein BDZ89DRAFT_347249 [Hymenopellis radicata]